MRIDLRLLTALVAAALGALLLGPLAVPATAGHGEEGIDPDNKNQSVRKHSLTEKGNKAVNWGFGQLENSVIDTSWTSGDADIGVYDGDYDQNQWVGQVRCVDWNHNAIGWPTTCDDITMRLDTENLGPWSQWMWNSTGCHEFGHTGDLGHRQSSNDSDDNSCMRDDADAPSLIYLDGHDDDAIKQTF